MKDRNNHYCTDCKHLQYNLALIEKNHLGDWSPEKDCCLWLKFQQQVQKPFSESIDVLANHITHLPTATLSIGQSNQSPGFLSFQLTKTIYHLTLKMASAQVIETSVTNNSQVIWWRHEKASAKNFNAVSHNRARPEVLFSNLKHGGPWR